MADTSKARKIVAASLDAVLDAHEKRQNAQARKFEFMLSGFPRNRAELARKSDKQRCEIAESLGLFEDAFYKRLFTNAQDYIQVEALTYALRGRSWFNG